MVGIMGGRAAEELFFEEVTTGAQQDIQQANAIARRMVTEFGMSVWAISASARATARAPTWRRGSTRPRAGWSRRPTAGRALVTSARPRSRPSPTILYEVETMDGDELDAWLARYPPV